MLRKITPLIAVILTLALVVIFAFPITQNTAKKLDEYLEEYIVQTHKILRIDHTENGAYVFINLSEDGNVCYFLRNSYFGWTYDYSVHSSTLGPLREQSGFSMTYFPKVKKMDYPVFFGKVNDKEIEKIKFTNTLTDEDFSAEITVVNGTKLWTMNMDAIGTEDVTIRAYSLDNELVSQIDVTSDKIKYNYYKNIKEGTRYKILDR